MRRIRARVSDPARLVELPNGDVVTFTQRGRHPDDGFVRVGGRTVSGYRVRYTGQPYPQFFDNWGLNSDLIY